MEIDYIIGPKTNKVFGMYKYQNEINKRLNNVQFNVIEYNSITNIFEKKYKSLFPLKNDIDSNSSSDNPKNENKIVGSFVNTGRNVFMDIDRYRYAKFVKKSIKEDNVKHIVYQDLAYLLNSVNLNKCIVTCHDLIPWVYEKNRSSFWKNNIEGIRKADSIITGSEFSKNEIVKFVKYPEKNIYIIPSGVDHSIYYKNPDKSILKNLKIKNDDYIILYVGSEEPRQNVDKLLKAMAKLKKKLPNIKLIKIGESNLFGAREKLLELINELNLEKNIIFIGYVPEDQLPRWYNAADLVVYPCAYAGFGLPPLEAMACGTPVITSNTTSLPEVVGDAGIMINPENIDQFNNSMYNVLTNLNLREEMAKKGLKRSKNFTWEDSANKTLNLYKKLN